MIEVATCSYGEFRPEMGYPIRTSRGAPKWFTHPYMSWENVFPTYAMLQLPFEQYQPRYLQLLEKHGAEGSGHVGQPVGRREVIREWCCQTPMDGPHTPGCAFEPRPDQPIDYMGPSVVVESPSKRRSAIQNPSTPDQANAAVTGEGRFRR